MIGFRPKTTLTTKTMLIEKQVKGIGRYMHDAGVPLRMHISEVAAGERSHPPHQHEGYEGVYLLEGEATLEIEDETYILQPNEAAFFDPRKLHGLRNDGNRPMRYIVVLYKEEG